MKGCESCKEAMANCMKTGTFAFAHLYNYEKTMDMHIHDCYEIYFSISGGKQFLIDNCFYDIHPGDIFFINHYESHHLTQIDSEKHERIILSISPEYLKSLSTETTNLNSCFELRDIHTPHRLQLSIEEQNQFRYYIHQLQSHTDFGSDLLDKATFLSLMVFLNQVFLQHRKSEKTPQTQGYHRQMDDMISYINQNIRNPLSLEELSKHFYLSSSYICRIFKANTGTTINKYITAKRISLSKELLSSGYSVSEACEMCGFSDYSNYLKVFTKTVGISPKKYSMYNS